MNEPLSTEGYEQTKRKLAQLELRLHQLSQRPDIRPELLFEARRSYEQMIAQYRREIKLFEAMHPEMSVN